MVKPSSGDPIYKRADWGRVVAYWRGLVETGVVGCQAPRCLATSRVITLGHRLWGLDAGHIVGKADARRMGWTDEQINALDNSRPEHRRCNRHAGARASGRWRTKPDRPTIRTSRVW